MSCTTSISSCFAMRIAFEARSSIATYLYSAATHACLNRLRDGKNRRRLLEDPDRGAIRARRRHRPSPTRSRSRSWDPRRRRCGARGLSVLRRAHPRRDRRAVRLLAAPRRRPRDAAAPANHGACGMSHFSELTVDKYLAGELGRDAVASLRAHAAECARCGDALEDALAVKASFVHAGQATPLGVAHASCMPHRSHSPPHSHSSVAWPRVARERGCDAREGHRDHWLLCRARRGGPARRAPRDRDARRSNRARDLDDGSGVVRGDQRRCRGRA